MNNPSAAEIEAAVNQLKDLLIFAIVQTQNNNWIFITQVEVYYHDRRIGDVAQVDEKNDYSDILTANMERCQEGRRLWYELCFWCQKLEIVVTGGYYNYENSTGKLGAFLGATIPRFIGKEINPILFSPCIPPNTLSCIRMLRNYKKKVQD
ncbi:hypothetical protein BDF21DRAFT_423094 [Thamnidium elegans]|nr:hypothetical protein BDF21DRAFT_423094 [Thamnidium elegans]